MHDGFDADLGVLEQRGRLRSLRERSGIDFTLNDYPLRWHNKKASVSEVADAGRALLAAYSFQRMGNRHQREDYELGVIVRASLTGDEGKPIARQLCRGLLTAGSIRTTCSMN